MEIVNQQPSAKSLETLKAMQAAAQKELEKKALLKQKAVIWLDGKPQLVDAAVALQQGS